MVWACLKVDDLEYLWHIFRMKPADNPLFTELRQALCANFRVSVYTKLGENACQPAHFLLQRVNISIKRKSVRQNIPAEGTEERS